MIYIAYIALAFAGVQFLVALSNLIFRQKFKKNADESTGLVSVLIPARNEEHNILNILIDLQKQAYKRLEIIVFDDQSTDQTAELVSEIAKYDPQVRLLQSRNLPKGWLGKNWACHSLAKEAQGDFLLFVDADVRLDEYAVSGSLDYLQRTKSKLLSVFPKQLILSAGEKSVVPIMNYILLTLLPLILVRYSRFASLSAANGQFMLFEAQQYLELMPHEIMKAEKVEDINISRLYKTEKLNVTCVADNADITCRMYHNYEEAVNGFSKNLVMFFGNSYLVAIAFWLISTIGFIPILLSLPFSYFLVLTALVIITRIFVSIVSNQRIISNLLFLYIQQINIGVIILMSFFLNRNSKMEWKGRIIK